MTEDDQPTRRDMDRLEAKVDRLARLVEAMPDKIAASHVTRIEFDGYKVLTDEVHRNQNEDITSLKSARDRVVIFVLAAVGAAILSLVLVQTGVV